MKLGEVAVPPRNANSALGISVPKYAPSSRRGRETTVYTPRKRKVARHCAAGLPRLDRCSSVTAPLYRFTTKASLATCRAALCTSIEVSIRSPPAMINYVSVFRRCWAGNDYGAFIPLVRIVRSGVLALNMTNCELRSRAVWGNSRWRATTRALCRRLDRCGAVAAVAECPTNNRRSPRETTWRGRWLRLASARLIAEAIRSSKHAWPLCPFDSVVRSCKRS